MGSSSAIVPTSEGPVGEVAAMTSPAVSHWLADSPARGGVSEAAAPTSQGWGE